MKRRLAAILCALLLAVSALPAASALEGEDLRAADTLATLGLIDGTYDLTAPATRAQAAALLVRLAGGEGGGRRGHLDLRLPGRARRHHRRGGLRRPPGLGHRRHHGGVPAR